MKKIINWYKLLLLVTFLAPMAQANQTPQAYQVATNCTPWSKNLNCTMINQQLVDNALDQLISSGGTNWGSIGGLIANQSDLQTEFGTKQNTITTGTTAQYFRGDLSLATFPTNLNQFTNGPGYITGNQNITWTGSGDVTGSASGTTSISPSLTLATVNANVGTFQGITVNGKGLVTAAANQNYLTGNQAITLSGPITGSGTTSITTAINSQTGTGNTFVMQASPSIQGNVGLGTTNIAGTGLDVQGTIETTSLISANLIGSDASGKLIANGTSYQPLATNLTSIGSLTNSSGWLNNNGSGVFVYSTPTLANVTASGATTSTATTFGTLSAGNVGMGTLTVSGNESNLGETVNGALNVTGNVGLGTTQINLGGLTVAGSVGIATTTVSGTLTLMSSQFLGAGNANIGIGTITTSNFTMNKGVNAGYVMVGSSVGLGTWMPASTLPISGGNGTNYWNSITSGNVGISTNSPYGVGIGTTSISPMGLTMLGNLGIGTWSSLKNPFQIGVGEKPTFTISSSGNIGIGTDNTASYVFDANGNTAGGLSFLVKNLNAAGYGGFFFINDSGDEGGFTQDGSTNSFGAHQFQLGGYTSNTSVAIYSGNAQAIFIDTNQNVGIGTLTPTAAFVIGTDASNAGLNHIMCVGAGNCVGYTTGTITPVGGTTTTCTCLPK